MSDSTTQSASVDFAGKVAIVTGAAQGIGAAVVATLAERGAKVAALDVQEKALRDTTSALTARGFQVRPFVVDISDAAAIEAVVGDIEAGLGEVEVLVNVAGILRLASATELTSDDWLDTFAVNTHGVFFLSRTVGRLMKERRRGAIVTVGSNAAAIPRTKMAAYAASKAASTHFTKCLGLELAEYGVRCNIVSPGSTDTAMQRQFWTDDQALEAVLNGSLDSYRTGIPLKRIATPADIAEAVAFLASDKARHITMHNLCIDGGATLGV
ncbi:2,3-dihydro-2,3-dihydroxybenzoate dehydrogenase [Hahella sp. HN01]|uniref:2,3-dihydro-2,3-dihydroxybenzoate dehydrogenase n=1 Tax=Hahella sp. HN01 TaxID=2847262 RepID=UPI001C1E9E5A|nr:2,3-dihydro-2,3-dihydroxybenzoate dehydrogenase [Hahella sp. HN01]MBU6951173.1 2,3-dihydro-2,3-dihydroxybenzoate dehydrogenase [Hahella sp. HN01]